MIAGGVHACQNAPFWSIFTAVGRLVEKSAIRPFDRSADGLLIGEGAGLFPERLEDAIRMSIASMLLSKVWYSQ